MGRGLRRKKVPLAKQAKQDKDGTWKCHRCDREGMTTEGAIRWHYNHCPKGGRPDELSERRRELEERAAEREAMLALPIAIQCKRCNKIHTTRKQAGRHRRTHLMQDRLWKPCVACNRSYDPGLYQAHLQKVHDANYNKGRNRVVKCDNCNNAFYCPGRARIDHEAACPMPNGPNGEPREGWEWDSTARKAVRIKAAQASSENASSTRSQKVAPDALDGLSSDEQASSALSDSVNDDSDDEDEEVEDSEDPDDVIEQESTAAEAWTPRKRSSPRRTRAASRSSRRTVTLPKRRLLVASSPSDGTARSKRLRTGKGQPPKAEPSDQEDEEDSSDEGDDSDESYEEGNIRKSLPPRSVSTFRQLRSSAPKPSRQVPKLSSRSQRSLSKGSIPLALRQARRYADVADRIQLLV